MDVYELKSNVYLPLRTRLLGTVILLGSVTTLLFGLLHLQ